MQDVKLQLAGRLKDTSSVLVSVSNNPSIDQLAASLALTLMLNKLGKHATAVFGGEVPPVMNFLHPEQTIKKNTDSLRDFIISLDKEKADKLRYKLEDQYVKIFITPYNTTLSEKDLVFSQGDVNVEVVVALGVHTQEELDRAIMVNGRILHDATVATITTKPISNLGSINWSSEKASSLCEMLCELAESLGPSNLIDSQIANALLTGIVAETNRFSNEKTSSLTMSISSRLLAQGANQQLVATQLSPSNKPQEKPDEKPHEKPAYEKPAEKELPKSEPKKAAEPLTPPSKAFVPPPVEIHKAPEKAKPKSDANFKIDHINMDNVDELDSGPEDENSDIAQVSIDDQGNIKQGEEVEESDTQSSPTPPLSAPLSDHPFMNSSTQPPGTINPGGSGYLTDPANASTGQPPDPGAAGPDPQAARDSINEALKSSTTPSMTQFVSVGQDGVRGIDPSAPAEPEANKPEDDENGPPPPFAPPLTPPQSP